MRERAHSDLAVLASSVHSFFNIYEQLRLKNEGEEHILLRKSRVQKKRKGKKSPPRAHEAGRTPNRIAYPRAISLARIDP